MACWVCAGVSSGKDGHRGVVDPGAGGCSWLGSDKLLL